VAGTCLACGRDDQETEGRAKSSSFIGLHPFPLFLQFLLFPQPPPAPRFGLRIPFPSPFFSGSVPGLSGTAFVLLPRESDCISRMLFPPLTLGFRELHFSRPVRTALAIAPAAALGFRSRFAYIRAGTEFFIKYLNASFFTPLPSRPQMPAS
jgi:hypothetical protein